jgi:hypothetical protein
MDRGIIVRAVVVADQQTSLGSPDALFCSMRGQLTGIDSPVGPRDHGLGRHINALLACSSSLQMRQTRQLPHLLISVFFITLQKCPGHHLESLC